MLVRVKKYNRRRELISTDLHYPYKVRVQPAGLIELLFEEKDPVYIRFYPTDQIDIFIEEESNGNKLTGLA